MNLEINTTDKTITLLDDEISVNDLGEIRKMIGEEEWSNYKLKFKPAKPVIITVKEQNWYPYMPTDIVQPWVRPLTPVDPITPWKPYVITCNAQDNTKATVFRLQK